MREVTAPASQSTALIASFGTAMTDAAAWLTAARALGKESGAANAVLWDWMLQQLKQLGPGPWQDAGVTSTVSGTALGSRRWNVDV